MEGWCGGWDLNPGSPAWGQNNMHVFISSDMKELLRR